MLTRKFKEDPIAVTEIKVNNESHISINQNSQCKSCKEKPCTYICPSQVYEWLENKSLLQYEYPRCVECGACILACPSNNIQWNYPKSGCGVVFKY